MRRLGISILTQLLFVALAMLCQGPAKAGGPADVCCRLPPCGCVCPDDYCSKPYCLPAPYQCGFCDDYCPKPIPYVCPVKSCCQDDYCAKPIPCPLGCLPSRWLKCPPAFCQPCTTPAPQPAPRPAVRGK